MTALLMALVLVGAPIANEVPTSAKLADGWPSEVSVFRRHAKGSATPARVERVPFELYVGRVLQSGAMPPDRPIEALKAMAVVVATRATWLVRHPDPRMRFRGRAFDVTDGSKPAWCQSCDHGQFYKAVRVHSRIKAAVQGVRGALLVRPNGRLRKPQWSGRSGPCGTGVTGNRLPAMGAVSCVRRGMGWRRVLAVYFPKGTVRGGTR